MAGGLRVLILLVVLLLVLGLTVGERAWVRRWAQPLEVAIYPVAADAAAAGYLGQLAGADFDPLAAWLSDQARSRWQRAIPRPRLVLERPVERPPPAPHAGGRLATMLFSLRLRAYAFRHTPFWRSLARVRLFVLYHAPRAGQPLPHSLGMPKGLIGVVHVFADDGQRAQNLVVIAHELLHVLGASDKYDRATGRPLHPLGYAEPHAEPVHPQQRAEIMAGRIPVAGDRAVMPAGLDETVIGYATAAEIGW